MESGDGSRGTPRRRRGSRPYFGSGWFGVRRRRARRRRLGRTSASFDHARSRGPSLRAVRAAPGPAGRRRRGREVILRALRALLVCRSGFRSPRGQRPETELLRLVAPGAQSLPVGVAGRTAAMVRLDMIDLADDRVAPRRTTGDVAPADHPGEPCREGTSPRFHGDQLTRAGARVEPPVEGADRLIRVLLHAAQVPRGCAAKGVGDDVRRDRSVSLELSALGLVLAPQQGGIGDHDADVECRRAAGTLSLPGRWLRAVEHGAHEQVRFECGDGVPGPGSTQRLRASLQRLHQTGRVDPAQHGAHPGHAVGQGGHGHVPGTRCALGPITGSARLDPLDHALQVGLQLTIPLPLQELRIRADQLVDGRAGPGLCTGERAGHRDGLTSRDPSFPELGEDARHQLGQSASRGEGEGRGSGGDPFGESDLVSRSLSLVGCGDVLTLVRLVDSLRCADLPDGLERGQRRSQMVDAAEDGERLLGGAGCRDEHGIAHGGGPGEGLQRGREDFREHRPSTRAPLESGETLSHLAQQVPGRTRVTRRGLLVRRVSCTGLIHAFKRTRVRFSAEEPSGICG